MNMENLRFIGGYRQAFTTGAVTVVAAGTATAGHLLAIRNKSHAPRNRAVRLVALEVEFILTTAFTAAQEVGFDAYVLRGYLAAHTGATALTLGDGAGRYETAYPPSIALTGRIADAGALTAGTHALDTNAFARGSMWAAGIGAVLTTRRYESPDLGWWLGDEEGVVVRNSVLMGAVGVGKWHFTAEIEEYEVV